MSFLFSFNDIKADYWGMPRSRLHKRPGTNPKKHLRKHQENSTNFFPLLPCWGYWPFGLGSYSMREIASYSNEGLLAAVILWTRSEPWWGNSLGLVESVEKISHPAPCYLNSGELIAIILNDWYCSPKRDLNLGLSRIAVFEDCNATALSNHRWMRTCLMTW